MYLRTRDCTGVKEISATPKNIATYVMMLRRTLFTAGAGNCPGTGGGGVYVWVPGVITGVYVVVPGRGGAD